jgi:hypothetical protein
MKTTCVLLLALTSGVLPAQPPATRPPCSGLPVDNACIAQEAPVPFAGSLTADTGGNGGISVQPWDGPGVWLRWEIRASAWNAAAAWSLVRQVHIEISDGQVQATGPEHLSGSSWSVTYAIYVPSHADLSLVTLNGAIDISGVQGTLRFNTVNGAIHLRQVAGDVTGATVNGAVTVGLSGDHWDGNGLNVQTVNGSLSLTVPPAYQGHIVMSNVVGAVHTDLPVTIKKVGMLGHRVTLETSTDGAPIRLSTINGSLTLKADPLP